MDAQDDTTDVPSSSTARNVSTLNINDMIGEKLQSRLDIMRFLLPPLCHLSADNKTRKIIIENEGLLLLSKYFFRQWNMWIGQTKCDVDVDELETCLVTLLGIFLNVIVTEPELVATDQTFREIGQHAITSASELLSAEKNVILLIHLVVLGLMFIRNHAERNSVLFGHAELTVFLRDAINVLKEANGLLPFSEVPSPDHGRTPLAVRSKEIWADISELWFLGLQVFSTLTSTLPLARDLLKESGWIETILTFLNSTSHVQQLSVDEKNVLMELVRTVSDM